MRDYTPRLLLHIGIPKTGTVALQQFLTRHQEPLSACGILYPTAALRGDGHHDLAFLAGGGYPAWATQQPRSLDDLVDELRKEFHAFGGQLLLSSENFYLLCDPHAAATLADKLGFDPRRDVQIIAYLRRQDEMHLSWYNQIVKAQGYCGSLAECVNETHDLWDYEKRIAGWVAAFGRKAVRLFRYAPADFPSRDICRHFIRELGMREDSFVFSNDRPNSGLNADILAFQRIVNRLPLSPQQKRSHHKALMQLSASSAGSNLFDERPLLNATKCLGLLESYRQGNLAVAQDFFEGVDLFPEDDLDYDGGPMATDDLTPDKIAAIVAWILASEHPARGD